VSTITDPVVWAAGAVPLRGTGPDREVALVHRPAYNDWTLPKGKARPLELLPATAVREVREESGVTVRLGPALTPGRYPVAQTMKLVAWWAGLSTAVADHRPDAEVDRVQWVRADRALDKLTYADERSVLAEALALPPTVPLVILRHAKAVTREGWKKDDALRPLSVRGHEQLPYIHQVLAAFGVVDLIASPAIRCRATLDEYARAIKTEVATKGVLGEEKSDPERTAAYAARLALAVGTSGRPAALCSHADVIPWLLQGMSVPARYMVTAACVVVHVGADGTAVRTEWHDTLRVKQ